MITCNECRDELPEYALGRLDAAQGTPLSEHLGVCAACRHELAELTEAWAALPLELPPADARPELLERVMDRIERQTVSTRAGMPLPLDRRQRILSYALAGTVLLALTGGYLYLSGAGRDPDQAARRSVENLAERLGKLQEMEQLFASDRVRLVSLHPPAAATSAEAFVVWDLTAGQWHFYARQLPSAPAGKVYQIWSAHADGALVAGPTFQVSDEGIGSVVVDLPSRDPRQAAKAVVTLEPTGGSQQPSGEILLEAAL